jgi:hypothetical protein
MRYIIIIAFTLMAMISSFYLGNYLAASPSESRQVTGSEILEQARKEVPMPELPPKPAGRSVTTIEQRTVQVPETRVVSDMQTIGPFGVKIAVPRTITEMKDITRDVSTTKLIDATPEEINSWNAEVKKSQDKYENDIQERAKEIAEEKAAQKRSQVMEEAKNLTKEMIIPLITAITGLIGALAAFRWGAKAKA